MVMITDFKSVELYLKRQNFQCTSPKIKHCLCEFDVDVITETANYVNCTTLTLPNPTAKNIIMHQMRPLKRVQSPKQNGHLDGMNDRCDNNNVLSISLPSLRSRKQLPGSNDKFCVSMQTLPNSDVIII